MMTLWGMTNMGNGVVIMMKGDVSSYEWDLVGESGDLGGLYYVAL